jgi:hypothetical protein
LQCSHSQPAGLVAVGDVIVTNSHITHTQPAGSRCKEEANGADTHKSTCTTPDRCHTHSSPCGPWGPSGPDGPWAPGFPSLPS